MARLCDNGWSVSQSLAALRGHGQLMGPVEAFISPSHWGTLAPLWIPAAAPRGPHASVTVGR